MYDFLKFVDHLKDQMSIHVDIYYSKILDWIIAVTMVGCAKDYPESEHDGDDVFLVRTQDCDIELAFAKAHVQLKEWLNEHNGGY